MSNKSLSNPSSPTTIENATENTTEIITKAFSDDETSLLRISENSDPIENTVSVKDDKQSTENDIKKSDEHDAIKSDEDDANKSDGDDDNQSVVEDVKKSDKEDDNKSVVDDDVKPTVDDENKIVIEDDDDKKSIIDDDKKSVIDDNDKHIVNEKESTLDDKEPDVCDKESVIEEKQPVVNENKSFENTVITPDPPEIKRGRPRNSTPISPMTKKPANPSDEIKIENSEVDEKNSNDEKNSTDENKTSDSPARVYRKRVYIKTAIVTRKSALNATKTDAPKIIDSGRSMRVRRNSTGKIDNKKTSDVETKKSETEPFVKKIEKRGRKSLYSVASSEPGTPTKRKREDSNKSEYEQVQKILKSEDDNVSETTKKDDEACENLNNNDEDGNKTSIDIKKEVLEDDLENSKTDVSVKEDEAMPDIKTELSEVATRKKRGGRGKGKAVEICQTIERRRSDRKPVKPPLKVPETKRTNKRRKLKPEEVEKEEDGGTDVSMWDDSKADLESNVSDLTLEPLTVDTANANEKENPNISTVDNLNENSTKDGEKAVSLSPDMISEGVSEISVKQFYKKPEFLENNLGIEKDPKLGGIVQEVENVETLNTDPTSNSKNETETNDTNDQTQNETSLTNQSLEQSALVIDEDSSNESINKNNRNSVNKKKHYIKFAPKKYKKSKKNISDLKKSKISAELEKSECIEEIEVDTDENHNSETEDIKDVQNIKKSKTTVMDDMKENIEIEKSEMQSSSKTEDKTKNKSDKKLLTKAVLEQAIQKSMMESNLKLNKEKNELLNKLLMDDSSSDLVEIKSDITGENIESKIPINEICKKRKSLDIIPDIIPEVKNDNKEDKNQIANVETIFDNNTLTELPDLEKSIEEEISQFKILKIPSFEDDEAMRQKERHLKTLGLLTHKAAVQAKIDKQRRKKLFQINKKQNKNIQDTGDAVYSIKHNRQSLSSGDSKRKSNSSNNTSGTSAAGNNGGRQSLKITFQKGRGRQNERSGGNGNSNMQPNQNIEETYYTIQNEIEGGQNVDAVSHGRKSYNRNNTIDAQSESSDSNGKKDGKEKILIPEKASSFGIHPGRLCQDQCYYCGGKFGLYDTPCHVAQLKSSERQQKILANEEKLTIDNCLCDACFRHVDKRANVPSYRKRLEQAALENESNTSSQSLNESNMNDEHNHGTKNICFVPDCDNTASHYLKKKCIRKSIKKLLQNFDASTLGGITPMCNKHYDDILQYLGCALCKRRLGKTHMYHIQEAEKLEKLLLENNIPLQVGNSSAICKLCRYFTNLLVKPSTASKTPKSEFVRSYRKRLLQFHNVQTDDDGSADEIDDDNDVKYKENKSRKSNLEVSDNLDLTTTSGQMTLDNDVMVGYDVPIISDDSREPPSPDDDLASKLKQILQGDKCDLSTNKDNISLVLKSNPNISMRELFPGEEEMGLHMTIPFNSSGSLRTPEGWTRVQTSLQYDEPTRRLWEDLQKPYGNLSSFLRHLILLEKYFRNGDLVLSHNASSNATVYSRTVQNRLRSYDNKVPSTSTSKSSGSQSSTSLSIVENSKQSNYPITITTKPKSQPQLNIQSTSNNNNSNKNNANGNKNAIEILPITAKTPDAKQQKILAAANKLIGNNDFSTNNSNVENANQKLNDNLNNNNNNNVPPELISIKNRQAMMSAAIGKQQQQQRNQMNSQPPISNKTTKHNIIVLRDTLTPVERQNKNWRPNLMPVSSGAHLNQTGPLYETVDGRRLPALVQVQSGGKPYLISIHDYNRMCIIRREKILRDKMLKGNKSNKVKQQQPQQQQPQQTITTQNKIPIIPNKILEQNSLFPVSGTNLNRNLPGNNTNLNLETSNRKKQTLHQQQQNQMANLKQSTSTATSNFVPILPKTIQQQLTQQNHVQILPTTASTSISSNNMPPMSLAPSFINNSVSILPSISNALNMAAQSLTTTPATSVFNTSSPSTSAASLNPYLKSIQSSFTHQQQQQQQNLFHQNFLQMHKAAAVAAANMNILNPLILDTTLLSKIPKSLTVIPQQKSQQSQQGRSSIEDLTSA